MKKLLLALLVACAPAYSPGQLAKNDTLGISIMGMPGLLKGGVPTATVDTSTSYTLVLDTLNTVQYQAITIPGFAVDSVYLIVIHGAYEIIDELLLPGTELMRNNRDWYGFWCTMVVIRGTVGSGEIELNLTAAGESAIEIVKLTNSGTPSGWVYAEATSSSDNITVTSQTGAFVFVASTWYGGGGATELGAGTGITTLSASNGPEYCGAFLGVKNGAASVNAAVTYSESVEHVLCGYSQP